MDLDKDSLIFHRAGTSPLEDVRPSFWECLALKCASGEFYLDCSAETGRERSGLKGRRKEFCGGKYFRRCSGFVGGRVEMDIWNNWSSVQRGLKIFEQSKLLGHFNKQKEGYWRDLDFLERVKFLSSKTWREIRGNHAELRLFFFFSFYPDNSIGCEDL